MLQHHILPAIGARLLQHGACPRDKDCPHAHGQQCSCPKDELKGRALAITLEIASGPGGYVGWPDYLGDSPWPCNDISVIVLGEVEPVK